MVKLFFLAFWTFSNSFGQTDVQVQFDLFEVPAFGVFETALVEELELAAVGTKPSTAIDRKVAQNFRLLKIRKIFVEGFSLESQRQEVVVARFEPLGLVSVVPVGLGHF